MANNFYNHGSFPTTGSAATSASMRAELDSIAAGFDKMPTLTGNANEIVVVSPSATELTTIATLPATSGGTGFASYAVGDLVYANTTTTLAKLADVATGNALISGGVGVAPSYGKIGLTTHVTGTLPVANGGTGITSFGTGVATALGINVGTAGAFVVNGGALGTPSSGTLTNATGLPVGTGISGLGTNVATALGVNVGTAGAFVVNGGALGTPSSGTVTNLTGTASINIDGTVGATTPAAGTFTDLTANNSAVISVNTSGNALRITQTGGGNALVVEDDSPDSTPFVVNTDGRVITGATQAYTNYLDGFAGTARNPTVQFNGTSLSTASSSLTNWASADSPPLLVLAKSKSGTVGTMTSTFSVGDVAGAIQFSASDNTNFVPTALIEALIDGTTGTGDMPGCLTFSVTADGGSIPTERLRISSDGRLQINGENGLTSSLVATAGTFPLNLAATAYQFRAEATFGTANTNAVGFGSTYQLPNTGAFSSSYQLFANTLTTGGATLTNNYGVFVDSQTVGTNIYGVYSAINTGTARYNFYAGGTADNVFVGNVGIGLATAPVAPLHVGLPEVGGEAVRLSWNTGSTTQGEASIGFSTTLSATYPNAVISGQEIDTSDYRGNLLFYTRDTNSDVAPIERMRIDSVGNVGIGSTTSTHKLSIFSANAGDNLSLLNLSASATATGGGAAQATFVASSNLMTINLGASDALVISNEGTEATRVTSGGGFLISRTAVTSPVANDGNVFSGTYTPTLTNVSNVAASTAYQCQYMRVGNVVTVSGRVNIDATTTSTNTTLGVSLPIASNFASAQNAGGSFAPSAAALSTSGVVFADTTNDRASFRILIDSAAANDYYFMFTYLVI